MSVNMSSVRRLLPKAVLFFIVVIKVTIAQEYTNARGLPQTENDPVIVSVIQSNRSGVTLHYLCPELTVQSARRTYSGKPLTQVKLGNAIHISRAGLPSLPVISSSIIVPMGQCVDQISVTYKDKKEIDGSYFVEFGNKPFPLMYSDRIPPSHPDRSVYSSNSPFPARSHKLVTEQKMQGISLAYIHIYPVFYMPESGKIIFYKDIEVSITFKDEDLSRVPAVRVRLENAMDRLTHVENPEMISTYSDGAMLGKRNFSRCRSNADYKYVIVTNKELLGATTSPNIGDLLEHRKKQGLTDTVVLIEDILKNYAHAPDVTDNPSKLRAFVRDAYNKWNTKFVHLCGNTKIIPQRYLFSLIDQPQYQEKIPSDLYYQCIDGDYNSDNDTLWGEPTDGTGGKDVDLMAEVFIGRSLVYNAATMSYIFSKIMAYESIPESDPFLKGAILIGEKLGDAFKPECEYAQSTLEQIKKGTPSSKGFNAINLTVAEYYEPSKKVTATSTLSQINSDKHSIFMHYGHGLYFMLMKLNSGHEKEFTNSKNPFVYSYACQAGWFDADCIGMRITTQGKTGFWGGVLNARYGWGDTLVDIACCHKLGKAFWNAYCEDNNKYHVGEINAASHEANIPECDYSYMRWSVYETNLLTDPAAMLRAKKIPTHVKKQENGIISAAKSHALSVHNGIIAYKLYCATPVEITIANLKGQILYSLKEKMHSPGYYTINMQGNHTVSVSGMYICQLKTETASQVVKYYLKK